MIKSHKSVNQDSYLGKTTVGPIFSQHGKPPFVQIWHMLCELQVFAQATVHY